MIKWVRLDERMIHGQVATKWSQLLGVNRIIVADDQAASNEIIKKSLMMAAPATGMFHNCKKDYQKRGMYEGERQDKSPRRTDA